MGDKKELLVLLLKAKFYGECESHNHRKCNLFCGTCKGAMFCESCKTDPNYKHKRHSVFQVYKASEYAGLRIDVIRKYLNISQIQPYKINYQQVVYIKARPMRGQTFSNKCAPLCEECNRELLPRQEGASSFKFCSIECKYKTSAWSLLGCIEEEEEEEEDEEEAEEVDNGTTVALVNNSDEGNRKRASVDWEISGNSRKKRKGVPKRSPLF